MVRTQRIPADQYRLLVGSDLRDIDEAHHEIQEWADRNGYRYPTEARYLSVFSGGEPVREWTVMEREPDTVRAVPFRESLFCFSPGRTQRKAA